MVHERFSKKYLTYVDWFIQNPQDTPHTRRIRWLHSRYPDANLSELRGHAKKDDRGSAWKKRKPITLGQRAEQSYTDLKPREKVQLSKFSRVIKMMHDGLSFTKALQSVGVTPKMAINSGIFYKHGRFWKAPLRDRYVRPMKINENGIEVVVFVRGSEIRSMIGAYHNAVKVYLETGSTSKLRPFQYSPFTDIDGHWHQFETNTSALEHIAESREEGEFYGVYGDEY